jgi:hypothetical protein
MTTRRSITDEQLVAALRLTGSPGLPGDVFQAVYAATLTQPQATRGWRLRRRTAADATPERDASRRAPTGLAMRLVAAVVVVGLAGAAVLVPIVRDEIGAAPPSTPGFQPAGSLPEARESVTATTLADGRVLVVGGWDIPASQAVAQLWDPTTGTFSPAGALPDVREGQTATLLPNGSVLVVGGYRYKSEGLASAFLWDPDTMSFSPAGTLAQARRGHAAVRLPDGRVLIVGGDPPGRPLASAELWDPATLSFSPAGSLNGIAGSVTAALGADGNVLVVGDSVGDSASGGQVTSAERWDAAARSFIPAGTLGPSTGGSTVFLADGRVLIVGGSRGDGSRPLASAELWDPATRSLIPGGSLTDARGFPTLVLLPDGRVLVVGGWGGPDVSVASAELWDPTTLSFGPAGSLEVPRAGSVAALLRDGRVLVVGGTGTSLPSTAEVWHP